MAFPSPLSQKERPLSSLEEIHAQNMRLAEITARSAELVAELEEKNTEFCRKNSALARANAWSAELMADLELKDQRIRQLNKALSTANAEAAELMAEVDSQNSELNTLNKKLRLANTDLEEINRLLERSKKEVVEQSRKLVDAERQRVMIESIGTACHHLGQPFTSITMSLEILRGEAQSPENLQIIEIALNEAEAAKKIFDRLQSASEYRTEPYVNTEYGEDRLVAI